MAAQLEPPELAELVDFAERPRVEGWSLRSALCRYAQPEPARVAQVMELVRRTEWALQAHTKLLGSEGPALWAAVGGDGSPPNETDREVVGLLRATAEFDRLGGLLATWAVDRADPRPDASVDEVIAEVTTRLDELGIPREDADPRPRRRG